MLYWSIESIILKVFNNENERLNQKVLLDMFSDSQIQIWQAREHTKPSSTLSVHREMTHHMLAEWCFVLRHHHMTMYLKPNAQI